MMRNQSHRLTTTFVLVALGVLGSFARGIAGDPDEAVAVRRVDPPAYPEGPLGEVVRQGEAIVEDTPNHPASRPYSGNALNCTSCHLDAGRHPDAASFVGVATAYPAYSPREGRVITLEDRIGNCFMRSCNGTRPPLGSEASVAVAAYITWLSQGQAMAMNPEKPLGPRHLPRPKVDPSKADPKEGRALYADFCASCHGAQGQGYKRNPPVWGPRSYNAGAGLATLDGLTSWLKASMPLDDPFLSDDEARDLSAFLLSQPRPRFDLKAHLPPPDQRGEYNSEVLDEVREMPAKP